MGAYHGAQVCEIVGLFMMSILAEIPEIKSLIYRDDVAATTRATARQQEKIKQKIVNIFKEHGLRITIIINLKKINFLDHVIKGSFQVDHFHFKVKYNAYP